MGIAVLSILSSFICFYFTGTTLLCFIKQKPFCDVFGDTFVRLLLGLTVTIVLYSIVHTNGDTISLGFVLLGVCYFFFDRKRWLSKDFLPLKTYFVLGRTQREVLGTAFISLVCFFVFRAYFFYNEPYNNEVHFDYFCYSALGDCMLNRGIESLNCVNDLLCETNLNPSPYHYFEIWLTLLISQCFSITTGEIIFVEVYVILGIMHILGIVAIVRCFTNSRAYSIISPFMILLAGMVCYNVAFSADMFNLPLRVSFVSPLCNTKTLMISLYMLLAVYAFIKRRTMSYYILMALPLLCIALTPSVYAALGIVLIVDILKSTKESRREIIITLGALLTMSVGIVLFYFCRGGEAYAMDDFSLRLVQENIVNNLSQIIKSAVKFPFFFMLYHAPIIAFLFYIWKKHTHGKQNIKAYTLLFLFIICLELMGFIASNLYEGNYDHGQFMEMPSLFLVSIYVLVFGLVFKHIDNFIEILFAISLLLTIALLSISNAYYQTGLRGTFYDMNDANDVAYIQSIEKEFVNKHHNKIGVGIRDVYDDAFPYRTRVGLPYQFCPQIPSLNLKTINICTLTPIKEEWNNNETINRKANNTFTRFATNYQQENKQISVDSLQLEFVKQNKIEFMIVVDGQERPQIFDPYIDTTFYRPNSSEQFVFFKSLDKCHAAAFP